MVKSLTTSFSIFFLIFKTNKKETQLNFSQSHIVRVKANLYNLVQRGFFHRRIKFTITVHFV